MAHPSARTQVVLLTPAGRAAIAVVLVAGDEALACVERYFRPAGPRTLAALSDGGLIFGRWGSGSGEEVVVCRRAANRIEVHCHGGRAAVGQIESDLEAAGAVVRDWADWLAEHEPDPLACEARIELARATTARTAAILLDQLHGALRDEVALLREALSSGGIPADPRGWLAQLHSLLERGRLGAHLVEPWRIVLCGRPNVGKSSLLNALVGYERAIVFDQPGTTRDVLMARGAIDGWPVELTDTAGLRQSADSIEAAGVARARSAIESADLVLLVADATRPWSTDENDLLERFPQALVLHNKCDLAPPPGADRPEGLAISAVTRDGFEQLLPAIGSRLVPDVPPPGSAVPFTARQCEHLAAAADAAQRGDWQEARAALTRLLPAAPRRQ